MPVSNISVVGVRSVEQRCLLVDAAPLDVRGHRLTEVDRLTQQVEDPPQRHLADGHGDRRAGVNHLEPSREAIGRVHRDGPHTIVAEVLLDLAHEQLLLGAGADAGRLLLLAARRAHDRDRVVDLGQALVEHGLDHDALDLLDAPDVALDRRRWRCVSAGGGWWRAGSILLLRISCRSSS